ncbi:GIVxVP protein [Synechococcus sp. UW179A]|uniref:GIVxVP protein n=1 Tax=Synechococcus sp. UW179A TaxID=2575510 RepID=UPI000E0F72F6|nr:GIVxVP protein [Synechococcus sp. UW179A]
MARNRIASGIVMVPCVLLGSAFLSTAIWGDAASDNRFLAIGIGSLLLIAGLLSLAIPGGSPEAELKDDKTEQSP